jgi:hypothetical protein
MLEVMISVISVTVTVTFSFHRFVRFFAAAGDQAHVTAMTACINASGNEVTYQNSTRALVVRMFSTLHSCNISDCHFDLLLLLSGVLP